MRQPNRGPGSSAGSAGPAEPNGSGLQHPEQYAGIAAPTREFCETAIQYILKKIDVDHHDLGFCGKENTYENNQ